MRGRRATAEGGPAVNFELSPFEPLTFWAVCGQPVATVARASTVTLKHAMDETVKARASMGRRANYVRSLRQYLAMFIRGREHLPIAAVTIDDLEAWFSGRKEAPVTRLSNAGRLGAMFSLAVRRGWIDKSPVARLEKPIADQKPPRILTPDEARRALLFALEYGHHMPKKRGRWLAFLVLGLFVGIRPTERLKLSWECYRPEEGLFIVDAAASKVRRRRVIHLEPEAVQWVDVAKPMCRLEGYNFIGARRFNRGLAQCLGMDGWPQDLIRHTAASYLLARHRNAGTVSGILGNSSSVLLRHYQELVTPRDCAAFWSLTPEKVLIT